MKTFSVKNWEELQHYKDRSPVWIKLYTRLLENYEFGRLPDASKAHLIAIWLLASRANNELPYDPDWIAKRINATQPVELDILLAYGFIVVEQDDTIPEQSASKPLATCLPRGEENREEKRERKKRPTLDEFELDDELVKATLPRDPVSTLAHFKDHHRAKGSVIKDPRAAYRNWLRMADRFDERDGKKPAQAAPSNSQLALANIAGAVKRAAAKQNKSFITGISSDRIATVLAAGLITPQEAAYCGVGGNVSHLSNEPRVA